jgi:hypothetical protein
MKPIIIRFIIIFNYTMYLIVLDLIEIFFFFLII